MENGFANQIVIRCTVIMAIAMMTGVIVLLQEWLPSQGKQGMIFFYGHPAVKPSQTPACGSGIYRSFGRMVLVPSQPDQ